MADELNRWLRRVRPPTSADGDDWAATDEAQQSLADIHRRIGRVHAQRRARMWTLLPTATVGVAAATVLVVTSVSSPDTTTTKHAQLPALTKLRPAAQLLTPFGSCDGLLKDLRKHALAHAAQFTYGGGVAYGGAGLANGPGMAPAAAPEARAAFGTSADSVKSAPDASGTSTTNVQEIGVDEPDIVKTDGDRVITVTDGHLRVIDATSRTQTGSLDLRQYNGAQSAQLLASGDKAVVLMTAANYGGGIYAPNAGARSGPMIPGGSGYAGYGSLTSTVLYVDLSGTPKVTGSMTVDGSILDARMVGTTVRVVASDTPRLQPDLRKANSSADVNKAYQSAIKSAPLKTWLPTYTITGPNNRTGTVACSSVVHPADYSATSMLTVYTVDPTKPDADPQPVTLTADGSTVYATTTSLYVASSPYGGCAWCGGYSGRTATTDIHRFDITGTGKPTYLGSGTVQGSLLNQYSLSDYDGSLRVATTTSDGNATVSGVDVLDLDTLKQIGAVGGLGKGERVYAVRFLGALGYVVTYNQQDPLYVLDLSKPTAPRLVGDLEIPGFSSYLHDVGSGRLLGVGQDTSLVSEGGGEYAHNEGRMVQLFDVSNPAKPTRTAKVVVPNSGTPGDPSFDPHAFLFWKDSGLVVVPIANYGNGGVLAVKLDGAKLVDLGTVKNPGNDQSGQIERSMIVDGNLWTFSPSGVRVSSQAFLDQLAWIPFA